MTYDTIKASDWTLWTPGLVALALAAAYRTNKQEVSKGSYEIILVSFLFLFFKSKTRLLTAF